MRRRGPAVLIVIAIAAACASEPAAGDFGTIRYAGKVQGSPPLKMIPPIADPSGNVYTLYGAFDFPQVNAFVSRAGGGESGGCTLTKGDKYGAHGWAGFSQDRAWYWSGDALIAVSGLIGTCARVLDHDPGTDTSLAFRGVLPWVRDTPSRTSLVAIVQSPVDKTPFVALVDLKIGLLTNVQAFTPGDATNVQVIGVGGDRDLNEGAVLLQYTSGGSTIVEGWMLDADANVTSRATLGVDPLPEYGVQGWLEISDSGLVEGALSTGKLVAFDDSGGRLHDPPTGMTPIGVHKWDGALWLVAGPEYDLGGVKETSVGVVPVGVTYP